MLADLLKRLNMPHVFALLTFVIFGCSILTYIIPSGQFEREQRQAGQRMRTVVKPGTYQELDKSVSLESLTVGAEAEGKAVPTGLMGFLSAVPRGMIAQADIIFFIFMIGGVFGILHRTGVITATIHLLLRWFQGKGQTLTAVMLIVLSVGGSTLGMGEEYIPLVPIFILLAHRMGFDRVYGVAIVVLGAQIGFAAATTNPFTVNVAQGIAELPLNSGWQLRVIFYICAIALTIGYVLRYGRKLQRDPNASLLADEDPATAAEVFDQAEESPPFTKRHFWILCSSLAVFFGVMIAIQVFGWWMDQMAGGFFLLGMLAAVIAGLSVNEAARSFVKGMEDMVVAALVVGFAKGIEVVLREGLILDTVIHWAAQILTKVPQAVAVQGMLAFQTLLNFFVPSGSGQAAVTIPLMAPLADLLGISRQVAVFAFQCGDGFSNTIIPTSGILMAMLSLAKVPYSKWLRFMLPLLGMLLVLSGIFLAIAVTMGYQ